MGLTRLERIAEELSGAAGRLEFSSPVTHVYNPLEYAWPAHAAYLRRFGRGGNRVVLLGMNPGPWGMSQTGVPFGEVESVRGWMEIETPIGRPEREHPKRPVDGFDCRRSEVSGRRLWGWAKDRFGSPEEFFARFFVANYCPLVFLEESGRNRTPDRLPARERRALFGHCDRALAASIEALSPTWIVGVGRFAESRARVALQESSVRIGRILHPSPASPAANRGWQKKIETELARLGIAF
ncbi:MAG: single-stranded DNA-binding protein [Acidobacteriota bacterium]|nr:single-stranded DNA-binding protein [Acidobacteriota bacterium]